MHSEYPTLCEAARPCRIDCDVGLQFISSSGFFLRDSPHSASVGGWVRWLPCSQARRYEEVVALAPACVSDTDLEADEAAIWRQVRAAPLLLPPLPSMFHCAWDPS